MADHDPLMSTYARLPLAFEHGDGVWLWDTQGRRYLDALSGIAVCGLGHAHPAVARAVCEQAGRLVHTSNLYEVPAQRMLAERLCGIARMDAAFFGNSGAEANEAAIKLARLYGHGRGIDRPAIVVMEESFHGRTLATLTATGNRRVQAGFEPLVQGFIRAPYDDLGALQAIGENNRSVAAVLVEPIQGEGGVKVPGPGYLAGLRELCTRHGWLLMLDEVQTGMGRTGRWFAYQHTGVQPDIVTLAKALGNGVPIGACLAAGEAARIFSPGTHGSTFGGNPLSCRAALAVLDTMEDEDLCTRARTMGQRMMARLHERLDGCAGVTAIRGQGLIIGIELDRPCAELVAQALEHALLINVTATRVVRLLPPLILSEDQADTIVDTVSELIGAFVARAPE